jgi:hypothetical protein
MENGKFAHHTLTVNVTRTPATTVLPKDAVLGLENPDDKDCTVFKPISNRCV